MNGTHLIDIGFTAASLLGLHAGSLFMVMAAVAQTPITQFAGYADLPGVRLGTRTAAATGRRSCCSMRTRAMPTVGRTTFRASSTRGIG